MIGAIIGDIIGSQFEWSKPKVKDFDAFGIYTQATDDTVCTLAVANALVDSYPYDWSEDGQKKIQENIKNNLIEFAKENPNRGYGGMFQDWVYSSNHDPYNSYGNGSAMRVSFVGWIAKTEDEVKILSKLSASPTHNHEEGIKGAEAIAMCIYLARTGKSKSYIKEYVTKNYYPRLKNLDYEELIKNYVFDVTCQGSVPEAIYSFLISNSFEDAIRTGISLGGDTDTIGAMTGSIAEAYYKEVPSYIKDTCLDYLPNNLRKVLEKVEKFLNTH